MGQIAICDNDRMDLDRLTALVGEYLGVHPELDCQVHLFENSRELTNSLDAAHPYCLFILDIMMPGIDGIRLGRLIRQQDPDVPIIYTTSSEDFALSAFQNHALRYLVKPIAQGELFSALDFAMAFCRKEKGRAYTVKSRDGLVCIHGKEIILVENKNRSAIYSLRDGSTVQSVSIRGTFEEAVAPLPEDPDFTRPHKSFYVNMRCIRSLQPGLLVLDNGREIAVSRSCYPQANRDYMDFLARGGGGVV